MTDVSCEIDRNWRFTVLYWLHVQHAKENNRKVGAIGENLTTLYLEKKGFLILNRNYLKKWGEIDIVARGTDGSVHFVEVKTVSYETKERLEWAKRSGSWRPEDNVHPEKIKRLSRAIDSWLTEKRYTGNWQIDVAAVKIVPRETYATIKYMENVVL